MIRIFRAQAGSSLVAAGVLMYAASAERWSGVCESWAGPYDSVCGPRTDHLYDFLPPSEPWVPIGNDAQLAGLSVMVLAVVLAVLPWTLTGRRPGAFTAVALLLTVPASLAVGFAILRSGMAGHVVTPVLPFLSFQLWVWGTFGVVIRLAVAAHGWSRAAMITLALGLPMSAFFTYSVGSWDSAPWWEAVCGFWMAIAGLCLVTAAVWRSRTPQAASVEAPALANVQA